MAGSKRQTTFAKTAREQALKEKRARKQERKDEKKAAAANRDGGEAGSEDAIDETATITT
ncbi:MAG: hypothetical protein ACRDSN_21990 [Pseudonocardiaceae bacterium]